MGDSVDRPLEAGERSSSAEKKKKDERVDESPMGTEGCQWDESYWAPADLNEDV